MARMTDPADGMVSFQEGFSRGMLGVQQGTLDRDLYLYSDQQLGVRRFVYIRRSGLTVTAYVVFVPIEPVDQLPCFALGYAVPSDLRRQGLATSTVRSAIAELKHGLLRALGHAFYIEAVVGEENSASRSVAARAFGSEGEQIIDGVSGLPALRYLLKVDHA